MMLLTYFYFIPAVIFFITLEFVPAVRGNGAVFAGMVPGINLILALLCIALLYCKFMVWMKTDD